MGDKLLDQHCLEAMLASALRMVREIGIETSREDMLAKAKRLDGLTVRGNRIHVASELACEVLAQSRSHALPVRPDHPSITVSDRAVLFADHHACRLAPLTRCDVVAGTKLIDALSSRRVKGHTSGTPQDTLLPLRPIEQYIIGFRYCRNGGSTSVPLAPEAAGYLREIREVAEENYDARQRVFSVWVPSPLKLDGNELDAVLDSGVEVQSFYVGSMPVMGLTGPVDPVGVMTLALAETLGGAAILHRIFPEAKAGIHPHPEPMDPRTGLMAFGTPEWNHLLLLEKEVRDFLGLRAPGKECLTSACMPDVQAQVDKTAGASFGVAHGFTRFNLYPLCADEGWSHSQLVLDVDYVHTAWRTNRAVADVQRAEAAFDMLALAVGESMLCGEMEDTVLRLRENYYTSPFSRVFSSNQWEAEGHPDLLAEADALARELIGTADYAPPEDKLQRVVNIYHRACRTFGATPMALD